MGRLKWTPYEYYTSSPQEFYYACKGYFSERDEDATLLRAVAKFGCAGYVKGNDFDRAWPSIGGNKKAGLSEEDKAMILRVHNALKKPVNE